MNRSIIAVSAAVLLIASVSTVLAAPEDAGVAAAVNPDASGTPPAGPTRILEVGTNIVVNEKVQTSAKGQTQLLFRDGSTVTVGPNAQLTIDSFVYDPANRTAKLAMTNAGGLMRFIGGRASKEGEGVTIKTPTATIGIRGGIAESSVNPTNGESTATFLFGDQMSVQSQGGSQILNTPNFKVVVGPDGLQSLPRFVTPQDMATSQKQFDGQSKPNSTSPPAESTNKVSSVNSSGSTTTPPPKLETVLQRTSDTDKVKKIIDTVVEDKVDQSVDSESSKRNFALLRPSCSGGTCSGFDVIAHTSYDSYTYDNGGYLTTQKGTITYTGDGNNDPVLVQTSQTGTYNYQDNYTFSGVQADERQVFKSVRIGVLTGAGGHIDYGTQSGAQGSFTLTTYSAFPYIVTSAIDPSKMPVSGTYNYALLGGTPVHVLGTGVTGTLNSAVLQVTFTGTAATAAFNNITAGLNASLSYGGSTYAINIPNSTGGLTGSSARGDLSGTGNYVLGGVCTSACSISAAGAFGGNTGDRVGLVYKIGTLNATGAAAFGR